MMLSVTYRGRAGYEVSVKSTRVICEAGEASTIYDRWISNNIKIILILLENGADKVGEDGYTPLHHAVGNGQKEIVELILSRGDNINAKDCDGNTPLHLAAEFGYIEIAELLIIGGANIHAKNQIKFTPFLVAINYGKAKIAVLLSYLGGGQFTTSYLQTKLTREYIIDRIAKYHHFYIDNSIHQFSKLTHDNTED